ncbi:restriction endonuclease subunit S [Streptococcus sp. SS-4456]|uniref:restriction endonuclease subunit S n=1 Tax=Streptococcus sp. SS-4456 TaxID=3072286 RepID=UPI002FC7A0DE
MPNKERNIPKRRFKEFENADAWELRPLGEIGNTYTGLSGKTKDDFGHGDGRFVTYMNVFSNPISLPEMVEAVEIDESQNTVRYGDVLFTTSSETPEEVGMSSVWLENTENTYLNSFCFGFRPVKKVNPYYLAYLLRSSGMRRKISFLAQGISRYNISKTKMMELEISIPNENEQKAIGTFFSTLDRHITLHQRKLDKLKSVKQAYLSEMFPAEGERVPKRRFPGFTDDWELRKLGELTSYRNGKGYEDNQSDFGKYELINLNSISIEGGLKPSGKFINSASETLNKNDLVMVLSDVGHGDLLGRVAIIPEDDRFVLNQRVALLRNNDYADCKYLFAYINANQHYFKLQGAGSSQLNISKKAVENFVVHIPSQKEQSTIGTFFSTLDRHITLHQRKLEKLKNLKKALLNELFV